MDVPPGGCGKSRGRALLREASMRRPVSKLRTSAAFLRSIAYAVAAGLLAPPAAAQLPGFPAGSGKKKPPPVNMVVEVGYANTVRDGQLVPVRVTLDNNDRSISGRLELRSFDGRNSRTEAPFDLPKGAHKRYTLFAPLRPSDDYRNSPTGELILFDGNRVVAKQPIAPKPMSPEGILALSCTNEPSGLQFLSKSSASKTEEEENADESGSSRIFEDRFRTDRLEIVHASPQDLALEWSGYRPLQVAVLNGQAWEAMAPDQRRAFRMWVESGGSAILCGERPSEWRDPDGVALAGVLPSTLKPVPRLDCVRAFGGLAYETQGGGLMTVDGPVAEGAFADQIHYEAGRPLIVPRRAALGQVIWLGFDPFRKSFRDWSGSPNFWRSLLNRAKRERVPSLPVSLESSDAARATVAALPRLPVPPMPVIVGFGVLYALIFGPLNIWILRRLRRTVRSWLIMPSLAALMTLVVLIAGQAWGKGRTVLNAVSVLQTASGSRTAQEESLVGLFSPTNRTFDLAGDDAAPELQDLGSADPRDPGTPVDLSWPNDQNEGEARWEAVALQLYATRLLNLHRPRDLGGTVTLRLTPNGGGTVNNGTALPLKNAYVDYAGSYYPIGDLPANSSHTIDPRGWSRKAPEVAGSPQAAPAGRPTYEDGLRELRISLRTALHSGPSARAVWLVAESPEYKSGLRVEGISYNHRTAIVVVRGDPPAASPVGPAPGPPIAASNRS
jgi:hypothetical protein